MPFTEKEIEQIQSVFKRICASNIHPLQFYDGSEPFRTCCTFAVINKRKQVILIFQNFDNLSPYRQKILDKFITSFNHTVHREFITENIERIGWKCL